MALTLEINATSTPAAPGETIFECADRVGVQVPTSCFKQGKCRECLVEVVEGMGLLSPRAPEEARLQGNFRLSCRTRLAADSGVVRCHTMRRGTMRISEEVEGLELRRDLDPAVTRRGDEILLDGTPIATGPGPLHGVAIDIGTTTCALKLLDLETGKTVAVQSFENPQRFAGTDVMARIRFDMENHGRLLQRVLTGYLAHAIEAFPCDPKTIYEIVVAGNSTMRDIFFGLNVETIGQRPYKSLTEHEFREGKRTTTALSSTAKRLRLPAHPAARVYGLPLIASHVGADAAADLLAIDLEHEDRTVVLMDIGTNSELVVRHKGRTVCCSCPAGPAFEGGLIGWGMPALDGAIERVTLREDGSAETVTIGGGPPAGICGSGLIDLLSELMRIGRMNGLGRFDGAERLLLSEKIDFHERDVNELAQAKGAHVAALRIALERFGLEIDQIDRFYLAGGFARHLDVEAVRRIGLIPNLPDGKIVKVGNASLEGTVQALLSARRRRGIEEFVKTVTHLELETHPDFFDHFTEGCQFIPFNSVALGRGA